MRRRKALDLFCGAGGATKGLQDAGFLVHGIDLHPQPRYCGDQFTCADAMTFPTLEWLLQFDFIWASPPCQGYSRMSGCRKGLSDSYPRLIPEVRTMLQATRRPYTIENVPGAPLIKPILLCGAMFGARTYRHRLFECSFDIQDPVHPKHVVPASKAGHWKPGTFVSVCGNYAPIEQAREAMRIDWMRREELAESIPPYFSEFIGAHVMKFIL